MNKSTLKIFTVLLFILQICITPVTLWSQDTTNPNMDEKAVSVLNRSADFISKSDKLSVKVDISYEAVQDTGQKIEYGSTNNYTIQRPDKVRVDIERRDGSRYSYIFDGKNIWAYSQDDSVYATIAQPGNIDQSYEYMSQSLQTPIPLSQLFSNNLNNFLKEEMRSVRYVEESTLDGVKCDHLALRSDEVDAQLWIAIGDKPFPKRIIISYSNLAGQPEFRAQFGTWDQKPKINRSTFAFTPPKGAEKIPFAVQLREEITNK